MPRKASRLKGIEGAAVARTGGLSCKPTLALCESRRNASAIRPGGKRDFPAQAGRSRRRGRRKAIL